METKSGSKNFTELEVQYYKDSSINFPQILCEDSEENVVQIDEVVFMMGMSSNKGAPTVIEIHSHRKDRETRVLTYKLTNESTKGDIIKV